MPLGSFVHSFGKGLACLCCGGFLGLITPALGAETPTEAPAARRAKELLDTIRSADHAKAERFVKETYAPEFLKMPMEAHLGFIQQAHNRLGDMEIEAVDASAPGEALVTLRSKVTEERMGLLVKTEPQPPHRITGIGRRPAKARAGEADRKLTEAQAVAKLKQYVDKLAAADAFSGVVLLARDGSVLLKTVCGQANKDFGVPNRVDTKFNLGSMNKMFTAVAIAQLVEHGKLSFDDPLSKFLPDFPSKDAAKQIRIKHLLTHTAGLGSYFNEKFEQSSRARFRTVDQMMELAKGEKPQFEPGEKWAYSNTGFLVLGKVIEKVTGKDYYDYVRENVYRPAGMSNTDCYELDRVNPNLAVGYEKEAGPGGEVKWRNNLFEHVIRGGPAGGGFSTAEDLLRFDRALRSGKLVGEKYVRMLLSPKPDLHSPDYGFGFQIDSATHAAGHGGGFPGISSNLDMFLTDAEVRGEGESANGKAENGQAAATGPQYTAVILSNYGGIAPPLVSRIRELLAAVRRGGAQASEPVAASASASPNKDAAPKKDVAATQALEGTWKTVAQKVGGREIGEDFSEHRMTFAGDRFTVTNGDRTLMSGTWKKSAAAGKPASIDLTITEGGGDEHTGEVAVGIFQLDGDTLRWCTGEPGQKDRPTSFDTDGTSFMLIEFKREKP